MRVLKLTGRIVAIALCLGMFSLTSCKNSQNENKLNDAQIAHIAVTANQIDIDYGKIALDKSQNPDVKKFAETMIKDHQDIIDQATALAEKLGVTPEDNDFSKSLLDGEKTTTDNFNQLSGVAFDTAYIDNEVAYHEAVVAAVRDSLIPNTTNEELKNLLQSAMPLLQHHLEMAKEAQQKIHSAASVPQLNDAQIASVVVAANQIDVDYGKIALDKATTPEAKKFAQTMIKDHSDIIKAAVALATKLKVTPDDNNPVTQSLMAGAKDMKAKLNSLSGAAFDKAYIDNEVAFHDAVVTAVKNVLTPQTQNAELKQTIISVTPLLEHHLEMAKEAQATIEK